MKLYYTKGTCSLAVRILINELGLKCEYESVNLGTHRTEKDEDFYQITPQGSVPALVLDDKTLLTENAVIQQYLADTHATKELLPPVGDLRRYQVLRWLNYVATEMHKGCSPLFNSAIPDDVKTHIFVPAMKKKLDYLNQCFAKQSYLMGDNYCLADGYLFVVLSWFPRMGFNLKDWPNIHRYIDNLAKRPAIAKSLQEEGLV